MPEAFRRSLILVGFVLLCSFGALSAAWQVRNWGDALSPVDAYSEANAIREVRNFLDTGITANDGLGNVLRPGLYPDQGFAGDPAGRAAYLTPSGVYTHYPPGPEYLLYVAMRVLGPQPISHLRVLPLVVCWAAALYLGWSLRKRFGAPVAWLVMLACAALPMFSDADSFLHYDGYALALLLIEIAVSVGCNGLIVPFALLGFVQGWLSFDYAFIVALAPGSIELALARMGIGHVARPRLAVWRCIAAGGGFALAHLLHLAEVAAFYGSFHTALLDLRRAAAIRSGASAGDGLLQRVGMTFEVLKHYLVGEYPISTVFWRPDAGLPGNWHVFRFMGLTLGIWWLVLTSGFIIGKRLRHAPPRAGRAIDEDWLVVSVCSLVPCLLWYIVMLNHSIVHVHFLYRHLFLCFFLFVLFCATALAKELSHVTVRSRAVFAGPLALISSLPRRTAL